jgi:hypothetical protein
MMSTTAPKPATTPIPVQLSEPEFEAFILPHLSMPKRGPKCKLGYHRVFTHVQGVMAAHGNFSVTTVVSKT